ncbi:MAG: hypothetical protein M9894_13815 [Planctomycetes bacterium]|nr:hypothetical protein [Planctomycetota bacterium]
MSLPEVLEGALDAPALEALMDDIAATGGLLAVVVRAGRQAAPPRGPSALPEVRAALLEGRVPGAQLRYRFEGREWWDTVMAAGPGRWRVVRIAHAGT